MAWCVLLELFVCMVVGEIPVRHIQSDIVCLNTGCV